MMPKYHINLFWSEADGAWLADVPDCARARRSAKARPRLSPS
jgi:hypothetical protein